MGHQDLALQYKSTNESEGEEEEGAARDGRVSTPSPMNMHVPSRARSSSLCRTLCRSSMARTHLELISLVVEEMSPPADELGPRRASVLHHRHCPPPTSPCPLGASPPPPSSAWPCPPGRTHHHPPQQAHRRGGAGAAGVGRRGTEVAGDGYWRQR
jgi:hypothetical protein